MTVISVIISCALWFADKVAMVVFRQPEYIAVVRPLLLPGAAAELCTVYFATMLPGGAAASIPTPCADAAASVTPM